MRVLHVFTFFRPDFTGEGIYLERLQPHLCAQDIHGDVLAVATAAADPVEAGGCCLGGHTVIRLGLGSDGSPVKLPRLWLWLWRHLHAYDLVHFHSNVDRLFIAPLLCRMLGRPVVQSCTLDDGAGKRLHNYRAVYRPLVARLMRRIDMYVAISPYLFHDCLRVVPAAQVTLIPQGVTPPPAEPSRMAIRRAAGRADDEFILLFVGGLCERKGVADLVETLPALAGVAPKAHLHLVGPELEPGLAVALKRRAAELGVRERLHLHGASLDPTPWYGMADAFVFASRREGFGNALLEAMAAGLPVVARRLPGINDFFIEHGRTGLLWDAPDEMVGWIGRLAADEDLRRRIGTAAADSALSNLRIDRIAGLYRQLYTALLNRP